jgi:hypothetical protein
MKKVPKGRLKTRLQGTRIRSAKRTPPLAGLGGGVLYQRLCQYIRGQSIDRVRGGLYGAQIFRSRFAGPAVCDDVEGNLLPPIEGAHA